MATTPRPVSNKQLAQTVRQQFLADAGRAMGEIAEAVQRQLTELVDSPANAREAQERRDIWTAYKKLRASWQDKTLAAWQACLEPEPAKAQAPAPSQSAQLELVGNDVMENKILASRMVLAVMEKVSAELDDLRLRVRFLEKREELDGHDILRPEILVLLLVEQWAQCGMSGQAWPLVNGVVQTLLIEHLKRAYASANATLVAKGVMPTIELQDRVKVPQRAASAAHAAPVAGEARETGEAQQSDAQSSRAGEVYAQGAPMHGGPAHGAPVHGGSRQAGAVQGMGGGGGGAGYVGRSYPSSQDAANAAPPYTSIRSGANTAPSATPFWRQTAGSHAATASHHGMADETRLMTAATPLLRAHNRAQGVVGQVRRLFVSHTEGDLLGAAHAPPTPALRAAIAPSPAGEAASYAIGGTAFEDFSAEGVARTASALRAQTTELKQKAQTKGEKATIEIVALMFQAILAEERIPSGMRVWFARLQMPVLRIALEDPEFLGSTTHPARLLIDRMGSCVMGFDATGVQVSAMENEVRRIVQVIEQYPETGKKVYQIVYDEFLRFLAGFLTESGTAQKVVSVAQQVEQRETLTIQYTIEMRNMLKDLPVRDEVREFLFKVWAEVLAVAAVRKGPQHHDTLTLKKAASELVWAASAKPNRAERARVIQDLPGLLLRLRSGMTLLGITPVDQEVHIKAVSDTLADAFLSKTQAIPQSKIDAMAERLSHLEDFIDGGEDSDLPLDEESIEMMLGLDASALVVVANGGSKPTAAMQVWAQELELGSWYILDHNNHVAQVQFVWRSERKQLNLFSELSGKSYLIQAGRLASYLQAGLLLPQEEDALTVRATRDALAKIEANPERLLA